MSVELCFDCFVQYSVYVYRNLIGFIWGSIVLNFISHRRTDGITKFPTAYNHKKKKTKINFKNNEIKHEIKWLTILFIFLAKGALGTAEESRMINDFERTAASKQDQAGMRLSGPSERKSWTAGKHMQHLAINWNIIRNVNATSFN